MHPRALLVALWTLIPAAQATILSSADHLETYVARFNAVDDEMHPTDIPNSGAAAWMKANIPLLDVPDNDLLQTYYFRWWTYRKHVKRIFFTPQEEPSYVITEFLPNVSWAGPFNTIPCAAAHHFREGRWLHNPAYLDAYARFWFDNRGGKLHNSLYSFWPANSIYQRALVTGEAAAPLPAKSLLRELLPSFVQYHNKIKRTNYDAEVGLYFNTDNRDGMEGSISGGTTGIRSYRPSLNAYRYGDARAISKIARLLGDDKASQRFAHEATSLKTALVANLWDERASFFKSRPYQAPGKRATVAKLTDVRELVGYTPWLFHMLSDEADANRTHHLAALRQLVDPAGFKAPHGLTTAEQRHPLFRVDYQAAHECLWNGPSWPYATSITLTAAANVLNERRSKEGRRHFAKKHYLDLLLTYARAHRRTVLGPGGRPLVVPWVDENLDPFTGTWLARDILEHWNATAQRRRHSTAPWPASKGGKDRGKDYNHSTFADLVINGLIGLRPRSSDGRLVVHPLVPPHTWAYFCLDRVRYHRRWLTVVWDATGEKYGRGRGLMVFSDGVLVASSPTLKALKVTLPPPKMTPTPP